MKIDLDELKKDIEAELKNLEHRRGVLTKRLDQIKAVQEIVEEALSDSEDFRIKKALDRMDEDGDKGEEASGEEEDEPKIRLAILDR